MRYLCLVFTLSACASAPISPERQACRDTALERDVIDVLIAETDASISALPAGPDRLALRHRLQDLGAAGVEASERLTGCEPRDGGRKVNVQRDDLRDFERRFDAELQPRFRQDREAGNRASYVSGGTRYGDQ